MQKIMLLVKGGQAPKHIHERFSDAITEAKRLHGITNSEVLILQVVGSVKTVDVPVTEKKVVLTIDPGINKDDDLPF